MSQKKEGYSDPNLFKCTTGNDEVTSPSDAVFPIVKQCVDTGKLDFVGTGFFIGAEGLFLTASHVLKDVFDNKGRARREAIGVMQKTPNNTFIPRHVVRSFSFEFSDISIGVLAAAKNNHTGDSIRNCVLNLKEKEPEVGELVFTYAFPDTFVLNKLQDAPKNTLNMRSNYYEGHIVEFFPYGRDRAMLPNPCWRTSMYVHGGASGGPVMTSDGKVVGINSSSLFGEPNVSYVSTIRHALDINLKNVKIGSNAASMDYKLRDLVRLGMVLGELDD